jgi:hypothetical protein
MISETDKNRVLRIYEKLLEVSPYGLRQSFQVPQRKRFEALPAEIWLASELLRDPNTGESCITFTSPDGETFIVRKQLQAKPRANPRAAVLRR